MTIQTHYFDTRTLARANVEVLNGKFKDLGTTAPKGERWAVLVELQEVGTETSTTDVYRDLAEMHHNLRQEGLHITPQEAKATLNRPGSIIGDQVLKTPNNKPVRVSWRRNMTAVKLANHLAKVS